LERHAPEIRPTPQSPIKGVGRETGRNRIKKVLFGQDALERAFLAWTVRDAHLALVRHDDRAPRDDVTPHEVPVRRVLGHALDRRLDLRPLLRVADVDGLVGEELLLGLTASRRGALGALLAHRGPGRVVAALVQLPAQGRLVAAARGLALGAFLEDCHSVSRNARWFKKVVVVLDFHIPWFF